ncbi:MAG: (d)CMP kinase [Opitutales bacterium]|nr:(d)CMP kinase [Opitutales bacterium]
MKEFHIIAIDGGAAAGKSSTSRALAEKHQFLHVDTGSFYRTLTWYLIEKAPQDAARQPQLPSPEALQTKVEGRTAVMGIDGHFPGDKIRTEAVNRQVSHYAAREDVRNLLLPYQRNQADFAKENGFCGLVMEGRDIGSVVFPDADFIFFLHADPAARNERRAREGQVDSIDERDRLDTARKTAPLHCGPNATKIDTTHLSLPEVVEQISQLISRK